jgi:hypothetical protein
MEQYTSNTDKWGTIDYINTTLLWQKDDESGRDDNIKNMYSISETSANFFCRCYCYPYEIEKKAQQLFSDHLKCMAQCDFKLENCKHSSTSLSERNSVETMLAKTWKY